MNTQTFTQAIKKTVYDAAAKGVVEVLHKPAGRRPGGPFRPRSAPTGRAESRPGPW